VQNKVSLFYKENKLNKIDKKQRESEREEERGGALKGRRWTATPLSFLKN
jgi:hypothetical protein